MLEEDQLEAGGGLAQNVWGSVIPPPPHSPLLSLSSSEGVRRGLPPKSHIQNVASLPAAVLVSVCDRF